jgi:hypothetical protein
MLYSEEMRKRSLRLTGIARACLPKSRPWMVVLMCILTIVLAVALYFDRPAQRQARLHSVCTLQTLLCLPTSVVMACTLRPGALLVNRCSSCGRQPKCASCCNEEHAGIPRPHNL